jgi:hypothetical protein
LDPHHRSRLSGASAAGAGKGVEKGLKKNKKKSHVLFKIYLPL